MTRPYRSELREEQAAITRERILEAAHRLLGKVRPVDLAFAEVARDAGVSVRTVYRHFPTADDLFLALSDRLLGRLFGAGKVAPTDLAGALGALRAQFLLLDEDPALFRVLFAVPTRSRGSANFLQGAMRALLPGLSDRALRRLCGLVDLMGSPYAWDVQHANWGADGAEAFRGTTLGFRALVELALREPELFESDDPVPLPEIP